VGQQLVDATCLCYLSTDYLGGGGGAGGLIFVGNVQSLPNIQNLLLTVANESSLCCLVGTSAFHELLLRSLGPDP